MRRDPRLLLFPIITAACTAAIVLLFVLPVAFEPTGHPYTSGAHWQTVGNRIGMVTSGGSGTALEADGAAGAGSVNVQFQGVRPLAAGYFALLYFVSMFCATFFNVAFYKQIMNALQGEPVSILGGLKFAAGRWQTILLWTLFAGLVGYVIKTLEERFGWLGQIILRLLGTAWSIACVFVIPVMVTEEEGANPFRLLKKSASTLKQTWGESLIGYTGVSFGGLIVLAASILWLGAGIGVCLSLHFYWGIAFVVLAWLTAIILWSYLLSVASQIFRCALYLYAAQGTLPQPYTQEMMALAWRKKKGFQD